MTTPKGFEAAIRAFDPALPLAVGLSGGADSTALLAACAARWPDRIHAFHVHHGLQPAADEFERHCQTLCERLGVPLRTIRVDARHVAGESPEAAARRARYKAFEALALLPHAQTAIKSVAIAHHADDQVETLLLALSRGAGLAGLAAMPAESLRGELRVYRPLLGVASAEIRAWLARHDLPWVEDPTNTDLRFTRNRIRTELLPALKNTFATFRATFARSAAHAAEAQSLLAEYAALDLVQTGDPPRIAALQILSRSRQANLLRHWMSKSHARAPSAAQMAQLLDQIDTCRTRGHTIRIKVADGFCERAGEVLHWYNPAPSPPSPPLPPSNDVAPRLP